MVGERGFKKNNKNERLIISNDRCDVVDIFGNGKLIKSIIKKAPKKSSRVGMQNIVKVNLTGAITLTGEIIDIREGFEFVTGHSEVILGIDATVALMQIGETSGVHIDYSYGFRDIDWYSCPSEENKETIHIPPNSNLTYLIDVISVEPYPEATHELADCEIDRILHFCNKKRIWGNMWYTYGDYTTSSHLYELAFNTLQKLNYNDIERVRKLYIVIGNNLSITKMKVGQHSEVIKILNYIVKYEPKNTKAIYRLAQCFYKVGLLDECYEFLIKCRKIGATNQLIEQFYLKIRETVMLENQKQRESYSKIFQSSAGPTESFTTSTFQSFSTPDTTMNRTENMEVSSSVTPRSSLSTRILQWSIVGSSVLFLALSYHIFN